MSVYEPSDRTITTWRARYIFLELIRRHAPEVLETLHGYPFDCYRIAVAMNQWNLDVENTNLWLQEAFEENLTTDFNPYLLALREAIQLWTERFNLKDPWCLEKAFRTLEFWYKHKQSEQHRMWAREVAAYWIPVNEGEGKFSFSYEKWDPVSENRDTFQKKLETAFKGYLTSYCDRIENLTSERGFIEQKIKRDQAHFEWLVWYQVKNESQADICKRFNAARTTVAEGIKDAASMCGLTVRPPNPAGRPRKLAS